MGEAGSQRSLAFVAGVNRLVSVSESGERVAASASLRNTLWIKLRFHLPHNSSSESSFMVILLFIAGVAVMAVAIALSIALHEVGHLVPAKLFGVRVPQYMIGFGKTLFSFKKGETEYGIKAIPLGGYISMIGMYPPEKAGAKPSKLAEIYRQAREADAERIQPEDQGRLFYQLPVYKRIIIMLGGPAMNLLIGLVAMTVLITGFGQQQPTTTVASVSECVQTVSSVENQNTAQTCSESDPASPALAAGMQPGDIVLSFGGTEASSWEQLTGLIKAGAGQETSLTVQRDGQQVELTITPMLTARPIYNELTGDYERKSDGSYATEDVGFIGISPTTELTPGELGEVLPAVGQSMQQMGSAILKLPVRVYGVAQTLVTNGERSADSPVSVVGVGRVAGEIAATDQIDLESKAASLVSLIATMNLMLFMFNLVPLLPLDGGHVLGALWEGVRKFWARLRGAPVPGPFDPVKLLPLTWFVAGSFILMSLILIAADLFKPITVF